MDIEEKLDGANVAIWWDDGAPHVMSRGGPDAMDRAGQLGRLRAWVADRYDELRSLCEDGTVLYAEWLWMRHGIRYDTLPDLLVALDLWHRDDGFAPIEQRDQRCIKAGLTTPPVVATGVVVHQVVDISRLIGVSAYGPEPMEGVVVRDSARRRAKLVRARFRQRSDESWSGSKSYNTVRA